MIKIIIGGLLLTILPLQPIIGWIVLEQFKAPEGLQMFCAFVGFCTILFQVVMYGSLIVSGYKERKITTMFD